MQVSEEPEQSSMGNAPDRTEVVDQSARVQSGLQRTQECAATETLALQRANLQKIPEKTRALQHSEKTKRHLV